METISKKKLLLWIDTLGLEILKMPLFWLGVCVKFAFMIFLVSPLQQTLFIPFIDYYISTGLSNPYQYFYDINQISAFPYPVGMLYSLAIPQYLASLLGSVPEGLRLFLFQLPLFAGDCVILFILRNWLKHYDRRVLLYYWLSPVLIYAIYMHGQLDVLPIAGLFLSLFFLFRERVILSGLVLGLALTFKTHLVLVLAFYVVYLHFDRVGILKIFSFLVSVCVTFIVINIPYIWDPSFINMVFLNNPQKKMLNFALSYQNNLQLFIIPALYILLVGRSIYLRACSRDVFIMFLGFAFCLILLFTPPKPGWCFWVLPFLAYLYVKETEFSGLLFGLLQLFYLAYFLVIRDSDVMILLQGILSTSARHASFYSYVDCMGLNPQKISSLVFTGLQVTLFINCLWIYRRGVKRYLEYKLTSQPFVIGIGGNSGAGKTTLAHAIQDVFRTRNTTVLEGDAMHKWERGHEKWQEFTHLDPRANLLHQEFHLLRMLRQGKTIKRRHYDHNCGRFTEARNLNSNKVIVFEGLHPFYLKSIRELYDLRVFMKPEAKLMAHWKVLRDKKERHHAKSKVLQQIKDRERDAQKYIDSQSQYADIMIEAFSHSKIKAVGDQRTKLQLTYQIRVSNDIFIDPLLEELTRIKSLKVDYTFGDDDYQYLALEGSITARKIQDAAGRICDGLLDLGILRSKWHGGYLGLLQLLITYVILEKSRNGSSN